ncbi:MAG: ANTAR domain-containing protein [Defluviitaleaceae bacterium]|nr:ANTAR domain-containing protein [Defluviitaleaceae bacterium]MCL2239303.1 ANTAR domain-containing protein [Defluviitaleaceae bacterium]
MESALVISHTEKSVVFFKDVLKMARFSHAASVSTGREARLLMLEQEFDLVIINAPLKDESGEKLAQHIITKGLSQVILVVPAEFSDTVSAHCENEGILTLSRPIGKGVLWSAITLAKATRMKATRMYAGDKVLRQKINDIRVVDRAKRVLIAYMHMSENEAHRYIEKQAMDTRVSKRAVAEGILKAHEG